MFGNSPYRNINYSDAGRAGVTAGGRWHTILSMSEANSLPRRHLLQGMAAAAPLAAQSRNNNQQAARGRTRPNILYLHSHDTGRYVQPYGHDVPAPNMQKLANEGVLFRRAFDAAPTCSPSRAALLTGQCSHSSGMLGLAHRGFSLKDYKQHMLHTFRKAGYASALCGVQHVAQKAETIGYDEVVPIKNTQAANVAPAAVEWIKRGPKQPFFLDVGFFETHREFHKPSPAEDARFCQPPAPLPDTPKTRDDIAAFKSSARVLDDGIGQVLTALESAGLAENTLVVCTTDHGIAFPSMKCNLTDHGTGVLLIMRGPGGFTGGKLCNAMVSQIDLFPTLCDVLEIPHPVWLQGRSLMPVLRGARAEVNDEIYSEVTYHAAYEPKRAIRTQRYKYIRHFGDRRTPVLPNCDDGLSKDVWLEAGWKGQYVAPEQLYDLVFDPNETHNLVEQGAMRTVLGDLRQKLNQWMFGTEDPLLKGPVAPPPGATYNDPDGVSPKEPVLKA